jgi:hypothetical protein
MYYLSTFLVVLSVCVTHAVQFTCNYDKIMEDFDNFINNQLTCGQYVGDCVVNIDETINFLLGQVD